MNDVQRQTPQPSGEGVPIGGIGTGAIEFGRDGRFHAITINNNRAAGEEIPVSRSAFVAIRTAARGKVYARILQTGGELPFAEACMTPPYVEPGQLVWRSLYPTASYALEDDRCPLKTTWNVFSPIVPYDSQSANLPLILMTVSFTNPTSEYLDAAACVNWENLNGCVGSRCEEERGPIRPVVIRSEEVPVPGEELADPELAAPVVPAGLLFGRREPPKENHHGNYVLVFKQMHDTTVSVMTWNDRDPGALESFWSTFYEHGRLANKISRDPHAYSGAVCGSAVVPPGEQRTFMFTLSWHFPHWEVAGKQIGNAYAAHVNSAAAATETGLKYARYFQRSVADWHGRFLNSSFPRWFSRMLINSAHVLTTNSVYTRNGAFGMFESAENPETGVLEHALYSSLAPLLFFPELANRELTALACPNEGGSGVHRSLGRLCMHDPKPVESPGELMALGPAFVLLAYRNYSMTGRFLTLVDLFPAARHVMHALVARRGSNPALPEAPAQPLLGGRVTINGLSSYTAGLWAAGLQAYVRMARTLRRKDEVERFAPLAEAARKTFEATLWDEKAGQYRFCAGGVNPKEFEAACQTGQLAGEWISRFLELGSLFSEEHVAQALRTITRTNTGPEGVAELRTLLPEKQPVLDEDLSLSACHPAYYAALQIMHGEVDRGLFTLKQAYNERHVKAERLYNQPFAWDLATARPATGCAPRHVAASAVWHAFFALLGFHLDMAEKTLHIQPNLPLKVLRLNVPLFTPLCFGWLKFQEDPAKPYQQRVRISFESPIQVKNIVLRVPAHVEAVTVHTDAAEKVAHAVHTLTQDRPGVRRVTLKAAHPIEIGSGLVIVLRQAPKRTAVSPET